MPKVKLNRDAPLNEAAKRFYHFFRAGKSKSQICKLMGYSDATDCNRLKAPEFFTLRELRILYKEAQLPDEEKEEIDRIFDNIVCFGMAAFWAVSQINREWE